MFIAEIAEAVKAQHRLVSYHLTTMMLHGLVESEWKTSSATRSKGKAVRYHKLTPKAEEIFWRYAELNRIRQLLRLG